MRKLVTFLAVALCIVSSLFMGCVDSSTVNAETTINVENTINAGSVEDYEIATANNAFAFDLYSMVKNEDQNVIFAPYSIFTAMAVCYDGAEGPTKKQMSNVFNYPLNKLVLEESSQVMIGTINSYNDAYDLETTNALWVLEDYPLNEQYVSNVENYYGGMVTPVDFANEPEESTDTINNWVEEKTNEKIKELIPKGEIGPETRLVITNTVYFNGKWVNEFDADMTRTRPFTLSNGDEKSVKTMYNVGKFNYGEDEKAKILELPYKGDNLCMYMVLPEENNIAEFENDLTLMYYSELKKNMNSADSVEVSIPKFTYNTEAELKSPLIEMGVVDAFFHETANFSGITSNGNLAISEIYHQAFVDVHEKGTEAAAATGAVMEDEGMENTLEFKANHPFLFFIEDKRTGCILFMGKVESPEYEEMS
ncbi:serpin family protein [Methanococcoides sp. AM1]|uniref:serpin family protein n=1 Tax=Methanococcoides sp. AM1 TaxID=1201011 RepID=UPI001083CF91|nr:serpin family protein [Methanococcoides sp. AM1]